MEDEKTLQDYVEQISEYQKKQPPSGIDNQYIPSHTWAPYPYHPQFPTPCPGCGRCPYCGRGGYFYQPTVTYGCQTNQNQ